MVAQMVKNLPAIQETRYHPWVGKIPWRRKQPPTLAFLPGEFHGQRSLAGYRPWGHRVRLTEWLALSYYNFLNCFGFLLCGSFPSLLFSAKRSSFSICCKADLVVLNSLNFCLFVKLLISPSTLNKSFWVRVFLVVASFISLNISYHSILACRGSVEKSADNLMGDSLYVICCFFPCCF